MGWNNPPTPWPELARKLSGRPPQHGRPQPPNGPPPHAEGGDSPAWTSHRPPYDPPTRDRPKRPEGLVVDYAELHCHSNFSFLDGASHPEELVEEAVRLGLHALALTDHDGLYGLVRMVDAAERYELPTIVGAELSLGLSAPQNGFCDPEGSHLLVLARGAEGYHRLAGAITDAQLAGNQKGKPTYDLEALAAAGHDHWLVLTGCRKGTVPRALAEHGRQAAARELDRLVRLFGPDGVAVELTDHGHPLDSDRNDALAALADRAGLPVVATNNVHYAAPDRRRLAAALAAVRARRSLDEIDGWLPAAGTAHLRSGAEMAARFARHPGAVETTVSFADQLAFRLKQAKPELPLDQVDGGDTPMDQLRGLVFHGAAERYEQPLNAETAQRLEKELAVIERLGFPGYFLIVHDLVGFARSRGILCQGRGSAANSAVCFALRITDVDPIRYRLPFERFLSDTRDEPPDIDVDFDSDRREEVIQYVYATYGRRNAAQVANVITYRPKMAVRDMAKALGHSPGQQDAWSKQVDSWGSVDTQETDIPASVIDLATQLLNFPRHLGIHSGGMVLTDRPVGEVCPIEPARMEGRTVLQWDKDDCASMGLVKFDLLGLGMLACLHYTMELVKTHLGEQWTLATLPAEEPGVYDMLCRADSVGVFQVESRAQMATSPRLQPRQFYDLVIEIALIRPGPIQGGAVHPLINRKLKREDRTLIHPKIDEVLDRTLGVPLFQEQLMQMAVEIGGCTPDDADLLRRAMGSKRGVEKIAELKEKLYAGMAANGLTGQEADSIYERIEAFANFGFAESHAISFALLVYASSWLRLHYPAVFLAGLLRAQPMGFYSAQSLVADARRHGVEVRGPDLRASGAQTDLEPRDPQVGAGAPTGNPECLRSRTDDEPTTFDASAPYDPKAHVDAHRRDGRLTVRLGLDQVTSIGTELATRIVQERKTNGHFADLADLGRRVSLSTAQVEALATAGAFDSFGLSRRQALWIADSAAQEEPGHLVSTTAAAEQVPLLPEMEAMEQVMADLWATGVSPDDYPTRHLRARLDGFGVVPAARLSTVDHGRTVVVGGVVTHRQRPATASGVTFLNLEDETGMINVVCPLSLWNRQRRVARESTALLVRGHLERADNVTNIRAEQFKRLPMAAPVKSRDFR